MDNPNLDLSEVFHNLKLKKPGHFCDPASNRTTGYFGRRFGRCVNADAATFFTAFGVFGLLSNFDAFDATVFEVRSFAMLITTFRFRGSERS